MPTPAHKQYTGYRTVNALVKGHQLKMLPPFLSKKREYVWEMSPYGIFLMLVLLTEICQDDQVTSIDKKMEDGARR
jgi:hypothetical protein